MAACSSKGQWRAFLRDLLVERGLSLTNREAWTGLNNEFGVDVASSAFFFVRGNILGRRFKRGTFVQTAACP